MIYFYRKGFCQSGELQLQADFVPKNFHLLDLHTGASHFLLPQRKEERKQQGLRMGKGNHPNLNETGVSVLGAFKLDNLMPVNLILFEKMSTFLTFIHTGAPISYCPKREKERK